MEEIGVEIDLKSTKIAETLILFLSFQKSVVI